MSFVYFARALPDGAVKIGASRSPIQRARQAQTSNSQEIRTLVVIEYSTADLSGNSPIIRSCERGWHQLFEHLRIRGEWFRSDKQLLDAIHDLIASAKWVLGSSRVPLCKVRDVDETITSIQCRVRAARDAAITTQKQSVASFVGSFGKQVGSTHTQGPVFYEELVRDPRHFGDRR